MVPIKIYSGEGVLFFEKHCVFLKNGIAILFKYDGLNNKGKDIPISPVLYTYALENYAMYQQALHTEHDSKTNVYATTVQGEDYSIRINAEHIVQVDCDIDNYTDSLAEILLQAMLWNQFCTSSRLVPILPISMLDMDTMVILGKMEFTILRTQSKEPVSYYYEELLDEGMSQYREQIVLLRNKSELLNQNNTVYKFVNQQMTFGIKGDGVIEVNRAKNGSDAVYIMAFSRLTEKWKEERMKHVRTTS